MAQDTCSPMRPVKFQTVLVILGGEAFRLRRIAKMGNHPLGRFPQLLIQCSRFLPYLVAVSCNRNRLGDRHLVELTTANIYSVCCVSYGFDGPGFDSR
jgi:hypothetical protein